MDRKAGPAAALKTLEIMEKENHGITSQKLGKYIKLNWKKLAKKNRINIRVTGIDPLCSFTFLLANIIKLIKLLLHKRNA